MRTARLVAVLITAVCLVPACGDGSPRARLDSLPLGDAVSLTRRDGLRYLVAGRTSGEIREVSVEGDGTELSATEPLARLEVRTDGQRGLLGVASDGDSVWAAWTPPDGRIVVGRVLPSPVEIVWAGPESSERANGGHLVVRDGALFVGIGDLEDPETVGSPISPNGKILRLDPSGPPDQAPAVVSGGWNNPFAFEFDSRGRLVVADNSPGEDPERLVVEGEGLRVEAELPAGTAPSGLAVRGDRILVCGYVSLDVTVWRLAPDDGATQGARLVEEDTVPDTCRLSVAWASDDVAITSTGAEIVLLRVGS